MINLTEYSGKNLYTIYVYYIMPIHCNNYIKKKISIFFNQIINCIIFNFSYFFRKKKYFSHLICCNRK